MGRGPANAPHSSDPPAALVRAELRAVLASEVFVRSDRVSAFLRFIVHEALEGRAAGLKEPVIAMAVYGKSADFNGAADPIVRVDARRLRDKLREFYASAPPSSVIISVPKGSYAPVFEAPARRQPGDSGGAAAPGPAGLRRRFDRRVAFAAAAALIALIAIAALLARVRHAGESSGAAPAHPAIGSLAVLPLENLSGNRDQIYFADGLTEALITRLAGVSELKVISRTSVMRFREAAPSIPDIARTLGVEAVIEGAVLREGNRVRVTVRLVDGRDARALWAETYERQLDNVLALQSDVAQAIATQVAVTLSPGERSRLASAAAVRPEAYEHYLKGRFAGRQATRTSIEESAMHYERAVAADPTLAVAYAGLAHAYNNLGTLTIAAAPPRELRPKAIAAASRALELDPGLADAHAELGFAYMRDWRWNEANAAFQRAMELSPNDAEILAKYSDYLGALGRTDEGIRVARRALARDPLSPYVNSNVGIQLYAARRYGEAVRHIRSVVEVDPSFIDANIVLGLSYLELGEFESAIGSLERALQLQESAAARGLIGNAFGRAGRRAEARAVLRELETQAQSRYVPALAFVYAHIGLGNVEHAFFWLDRAYDERSNLLAFLKRLPILDPLRDDPRFDRLLRRVNLASLSAPEATSP